MEAPADAEVEPATGATASGLATLTAVAALSFPTSSASCCLCRSCRPLNVLRGCGAPEKPSPAHSCVLNSPGEAVFECGRASLVIGPHALSFTVCVQTGEGLMRLLFKGSRGGDTAPLFVAGN